MNDHIFIIAEAGVNHNGSAELGFEMVNCAERAGVDAIKFQTFKTERVVSRFAATAQYQRIGHTSNQSQFEMLNKLELSKEDFRSIKDHCENSKILFMSTPDDVESMEFLVNLGVPALKIGSGELNNYDYLRIFAETNIPLILSTGMGTLGEVERAINIIESAQRITDAFLLPPLTLLHCTTSYPCPMGDVNLRAIMTLRAAFGLPVGYSDHTEGVEVTMAAIGMGACVIEKHFTLDKQMEGPDHKASLNSEELAFMVKQIRNIEKALGDGRKKPSADEIEISKVVRKSLVAKQKLKAGTKLNPGMLEYKRPGEGLTQEDLRAITGMVLKQDLDRDEVLQWEHFK